MTGNPSCLGKMNLNGRFRSNLMFLDVEEAAIVR